MIYIIPFSYRTILNATFWILAQTLKMRATYWMCSFPHTILHVGTVFQSKYKQMCTVWLTTIFHIAVLPWRYRSKTPRVYCIPVRIPTFVTSVFQIFIGKFGNTRDHVIQPFDAGSSALSVVKWTLKGFPSAFKFAVMSWKCRGTIFDQ